MNTKTAGATVEGEVIIDGAAVVVPPVNEEIVVAIGAEPSLSSDSDDELIDGEPAPQLVKDLRKKAREDAKRIRELEAAAVTRATEEKQPDAIVVGVKPSLESCDYDADKFESSLLAWTDRKAKAEQQDRERNDKKTETDRAYATRLDAYRVGATALKVPDFEASEKAIERALTPMQQSIIVKLAKNSALFVYALGRDPAKLKELSEITDPVAFGYNIAAVEKEIKTMPKSQFTAEKRPNASGGGAPLAAGDKALEAARAKAEQTGNYTEVNRINAANKEAARKRDAA